ncbi:MAG: PIG-L family deacetylase [Planctomycetaceae bacterium]|nr:PIG-L family deacetylase [Planctomycetaceae bacterium]
MHRHPPRNLGVNRLRLLVVAAHQDDGELGCGGFLLQAANYRAQTTVCVLADGCAGGNVCLREQEAREAAVALGADLIQAGLPDTRIPLRPAIKIVEKVIAEVEPHVVLVHAPADTHQDHRVTARAVMSAARDVPNILFYEGPSSRNFVPVTYVDIDAVIERKVDLIRLHRSQISRRPFDAWARTTALYRGMHARPACQFAEAFHPARQFLVPAGLSLAGSLDSAQSKALASWGASRPGGNGRPIISCASVLDQGTTPK